MSESRSTKGTIALLLCRVVVPLWILAGATFKLIHGDPTSLPKETILEGANALGLNLTWTLATLIGLELFAVAVMFALPRFARLMAVFMLSVFCLILIGEMVQGNFASCGCLGDVPMPPWLMLAIDGLLLAGVMVSGPLPRRLAREGEPAGHDPALARRAGVVALLAIVGFAVSFWRIGEVAEEFSDRPPVANGTGSGSLDDLPIGDPTVNPAVWRPDTSYWITDNIAGWVGREWRELDLFRMMDRWPVELDDGTHYVVFYSRTCDHCEDMFHFDLDTNPELARRTVAIEIPDSRHVVTSPDGWEMPPTETVLFGHLPLDVQWIITPPLALRIEDGIVTCANEGDHSVCME